MKRFLSSVGLSILFILLPQFSGSAVACSCLPLPGPYKAFRDATAVFVGRVVGSKDVSVQEQWGDKSIPAQHRQFLFQVEEAFKGVKGSRLEVTVGRIDSSCYTGFTVGESYLIYAYGESGKIPGTGMCTRNTGKAYARDDIHYIRALLKGLPEPRVYGSVERLDSDLTGNQRGLSVPLEGVKVIVEGEGRRYEAVTDSQGLYGLYNVPDGRYKARPLLPDKYMLYWPGEEEFVLRSEEQPEDYLRIQQGPSAYLGFRAGWNNRIRGRILDAEGNIIKRARASLLSGRSSSSSTIIVREDSFDYHKDGVYEFYGLTPDSYFLALTISAPFRSKKMSTRFYYPGVLSLNQASEIEVSESGSLTDRDIRLPPEYLVRPVEGEVVWSDGTPVEDAWVMLSSSARSEEEGEKYDVGNSDRQGRFSLQAFVGAEYWVYASISSSEMKTNTGKDLYDTGVRVLKAPAARVTVGRVNEPLKLVIQLPEGVQKRAR